MKLSDFGPGLLLAATGIGVGDMVSSTIAGAEYGLTLVWALVFGVIIKFAITEGAARWQLATGATLIEGWRESLPTVAVAAVSGAVEKRLAEHPHASSRAVATETFRRPPCTDPA